MQISMSVHESEHPEESPSRGGEGDESCEPVMMHLLMCFDNEKLKQRWLFTLTSLLQLIRTSVTIHRPEVQDGNLEVFRCVNLFTLCKTLLTCSCFV